MLQNSNAFGGFSVKDINEAHHFYSEVLGLKVVKNEMGILELHFPGDSYVILYPKPDHQPAVFTVLSFPVEDIDATVDALLSKGITMEIYEGFNQDEKGIAWGNGPSIAWFKDPSDNILAVLSNNRM